MVVQCGVMFQFKSSGGETLGQQPLGGGLKLGQKSDGEKLKLEQQVGNEESRVKLGGLKLGDKSPVKVVGAGLQLGQLDQPSGETEAGWQGIEAGPS